MHPRSTIFIIIILVIAGFYFRYTGIVKQLSYWNDESHAAIYARGLVEEGRAVNPAGGTTGLYQSALYAVTAVSFKLFGVSEFTGRLPSVLAGTALILLVYYVTKKMLDDRIALFASAITSFSQTQLAWSTQLRPYIWLELCAVGVIYFCYLHIQHRRRFLDWYLLYAFIFTGISFFFHTTGLMNIIIIALAIIIKSIYEKKYVWILLLIPVAGLFVGALYLMYHTAFNLIFRFENDTLHYRIFLTQNYKWLVAGSILGAALMFRKHRNFAVFLSLSIIAIFAMAIFKIQSNYVRYSLTAFPLMYILFAAGVFYTIDLINEYIKHSRYTFVIAIVMIGIALAYPIKKQKILLMPQYYYTINADMRENPIVDYKTAFAKIEDLLKDRRDAVVLDAWNDRVPWYMPHQRFIFVNRDNKATKDSIYGEEMISTVSQFEKLKQENRAGVVIVENWESQTAPDVQNYFRKTLNHEFDVNNLPYNENDKWSISIYSWGI